MYLRVINGIIVDRAKDFDTLQDQCDEHMQGFVISEADFASTRIEMMQDIANDINEGII